MDDKSWLIIVDYPGWVLYCIRPYLFVVINCSIWGTVNTVKKRILSSWIQRLNKRKHLTYAVPSSIRLKVIYVWLETSEQDYLLALHIWLWQYYSFAVLFRRSLPSLCCKWSRKMMLLIHFNRRNVYIYTQTDMQASFASLGFLWFP